MKYTYVSTQFALFNNGRPTNKCDTFRILNVSKIANIVKKKGKYDCYLYLYIQCIVFL